jgi:hypothetical protein
VQTTALIVVVFDGQAETTALIHEVEVRLGIHQDDSNRRPPSGGPS